MFCFCCHHEVEVWLLFNNISIYICVHIYRYLYIHTHTFTHSVFGMMKNTKEALDLNSLFKLMVKLQILCTRMVEVHK